MDKNLVNNIISSIVILIIIVLLVDDDFTKLALIVLHVYYNARLFNLSKKMNELADREDEKK